jgi:hypothetical protein
MKNNINNFPCLIKIADSLYECDFDHKSIDILETILGIGFYKIYENFAVKNILTSTQIIDLISVSAFKYHGISASIKIKNYLSQKKQISLNDLATLKVHFKNLLPDLISLKQNLLYLNPKSNPIPSNSDFYNFEENYALARKYLGWSDYDFWSSTPKKLSFSMIALAKYEKEKDKFLQKQQFSNCINFLNGIKKML